MIGGFSIEGIFKEIIPSILIINSLYIPCHPSQDKHPDQLAESQEHPPHPRRVNHKEREVMAKE
jgi:hypothetical protein